MVGCPGGRFSNFPWLGDPLRLLFGVLLRPKGQPQLSEIPFCQPRQTIARSLAVERSSCRPRACVSFPEISVASATRPALPSNLRSGTQGCVHVVPVIACARYTGTVVPFATAKSLLPSPLKSPDPI